MIRKKKTIKLSADWKVVTPTAGGVCATDLLWVQCLLSTLCPLRFGGAHLSFLGCDETGAGWRPFIPLLNPGVTGMLWLCWPLASPDSGPVHFPLAVHCDGLMAMVTG